MSALNISANGAEVNLKLLAIEAHNSANTNTIGFKRILAHTEDLAYNTKIRSGGDKKPFLIQQGSGARVGGTYSVNEVGEQVKSDQRLNVALTGAKGLFKVETPGGDVAYTRSGAFRKDSDGALVTSSGYRLADNIVIPGDVPNDTILISPFGAVTQIDGVNRNELGNIKLYAFNNFAGLEAKGDGLFVPSFSSGEAVEGTPGEDGYSSLLQGHYEASNVKNIESMINIIKYQRGATLSYKVISMVQKIYEAQNQI